MANEITNVIQRENKLHNELAINIQYKLKAMKEEIINIKYAIHWAKAGIINSLILSNTEINLAINTIDSDNLPYSTPEEALDFADVKIISSNLCLLYIIYIPITTLELYEKLAVKPVKMNNKITEIEYENIIKSHDKIYSIISKCRTINSLSICKQDSLLDISNSTCLPKLLKSRPSTCNYTNNHHIPTVSEIAEGLILLNQYDGKIHVENETQQLNGTYLVKFSNLTISVGNRIFVSKEKSIIQVLPAILQPKPDDGVFKETLSLQMMKDIHINNTNHIALLQSEKSMQQILNWGPFSIVVIILISATVISMKNRKTRIINTTNIESPTTAEPIKQNEEISRALAEEKQARKQTPEIASHPKRKFYETPFF